MKTQNTTAMLLGASALAALALPAQAGTSSKGPIAPNPGPIAEESGSLFDSLNGSLSVGYDSDYFFRGTDFGEHALWTGLDFSIPVGEKVSFDIGAWYINSPEDSFAEELDLYASLTYSITDNWSITAGYTFYTFFGDGDEINEPYLSTAFGFAGLDLELAGYYDDNTDGFYFAATAGYGIEVTSWLTITPSVTVSYAEDYYGVSGFNHVLPAITADIALTDNATLSPYIAGNIPLDDLKDATGQDAEVFGGVALAVSF